MLDAPSQSEQKWKADWLAALSLDSRMEHWLGYLSLDLRMEDWLGCLSLDLRMEHWLGCLSLDLWMEHWLAGLSPDSVKAGSFQSQKEIRLCSPLVPSKDLSKELQSFRSMPAETAQCPKSRDTIRLRSLPRERSHFVAADMFVEVDQGTQRYCHILVCCPIWTVPRVRHPDRFDKKRCRNETAYPTGMNLVRYFGSVALRETPRDFGSRSVTPKAVMRGR